MVFEQSLMVTHNVEAEVVLEEETAMVAVNMNCSDGSLGLQFVRTASCCWPAEFVTAAMPHADPASGTNRTYKVPVESSAK